MTAAILPGYAVPVITEPDELAALVTAAAHDAHCLVVTYVDEAGKVTARGLWPVILKNKGEAVWLSSKGNGCFAAHDSLSQQIRTFRIDRLVDAHCLEP